MANWAYTDYAIEGSNEVLKKIHEAIQHPVIEKGASNDWEGGVLKALNPKWEEKDHYMRGFIQKDTVELGNEVLSFGAEEAWGATDFHEALEQIFPDDIKVFYCVEEQGCEVYATNDAEGRHFPQRYWVDTCIDGNYQSEYFIAKESAYEWLSEITEGRVKNEEDVESFNSDYEDSEALDENFIYVHEFEIV